MPLTWNYPPGVWAAMSEEDKKNRDVFVMSSIVVDLGDVTEENAAEWLYRLRFTSKLNEPLWWMDRKPWLPTLEQIKAHAGLKMNVTEKTRGQFEKKCVEIFRRRYDSEFEAL